MKNVKVKVQYIMSGEYVIPLSDEDYEALIIGVDDSFCETDIANEAFVKFRKDMGLSNVYNYLYDSDYSIETEDGEVIIGWG